MTSRDDKLLLILVRRETRVVWTFGEVEPTVVWWAVDRLGLPSEPSV